MEEQPEQVDLSTLDIAAENREALALLLPGVLADGVLDATRLGELLDVEVTAPTDGRERFGLMWAGKHEAIRSLLTPSHGTLIPDLENSIDFDTAQNVFIEGDNLEVLKLLQKAYNDEVDLIYIDPPYNTGSDFIYNDDFSDGLSAYLSYTGQQDEEGNRLVADSETAGRRHSQWLSFIYPRLILARNLLRPDGLLCVSIDDNEIDNLKKILDEVFGEENLVSILAVEMSKTQGMKVAAAQNGRIVKNHEYVLIYSRNAELASKDRQPLYDASERYDDHYDIVWDGESDSKSLAEALADDPVFAGCFEKYGLRISKKNFRKVLELDADIYERFLGTLAASVYRESPISLDRIQQLDLDEGAIVRFERYILRKNSRGTVVQLQSFADGVRQTDDYRSVRSRATIRGALWKGFHSDMMNVGKEGGVDFKNGKKPMRLIKQLVKWANRSDALVLDFFAGSGTTAHAVASLNRDDGGSRRFLLIQLPEPVSGPGGGLVSDLTIERLCNVLEDFPEVEGLKSYRLVGSAFRGPESTSTGELFDLSERTLSEEDRSYDEIAAEILLAEGVPLGTPWLRSDSGEGSVVVAANVAVSVSTLMSDEIVDEVLSLGRPVAVFLEDAFVGNDGTRVNAFSRARELGITMKTV